MNGFIDPRDIAYRLFRRHRFWYHGKPKIVLEGEDNKFGKLKFDFGDEVVEYKIYICDRDAILDAAHMAVENFSELVQQIILDMSE